MDKLSLGEKEIIDIYYGEAEQDFYQDKQSNINKAFQNKLGITLSNMDISEYQSDDSNVQISISNIIDRAYSIKTKKKNSLEMVGFIITSLILLALFPLITISIGAHLFIYIQLGIFLLLPFSLIPLSKIAIDKGGA
jgi:hypothetical protein